MLFSYLFYFTVLFICIFVAYWADKCGSKKILYLLISIFVFVTGFRNEEVGIDTPNYIELWDGIMSDDLIFVELGFQWLMLILQKISLNPVILFFTCSLIIYFFIIIRLWEFRKIASFPMMILVLYTFSLMPSMNVMRQYCAIAIIFYFTRYFFKKQYFKYFVGIIIATLLHTSALSAISLWGFELFWWNTLTRTKKFFFICAIVFFPLIILQLYTLMSSEYGQYFEDEKQSLGLLTLLKFAFILLSFYCSKLWSKHVDIANCGISEYSYVIKFIFLTYLFGVTLESLTYFFPFMGRIGLPFSIFGVIYIGILFKMTKNTFLKGCYFIAFLILYGMPFLISMIANGYGTMPYSFCWQ